MTHDILATIGYEISGTTNCTLVRGGAERGNI